MSVSRKRRSTLLVRVDPESLFGGSEKAEDVAICRSGLLQQPEQRQKEGDQELKEDDRELLRLMVAFIQELTRRTVSSDAIILALYSAKAKVSPSKKVLEVFAEVVAGEYTQRYYPKDF